jgi:hypothetical protein
LGELGSVATGGPMWGATLPHLLVPRTDEWLLGLLLRCDLANGWFAGTTARLVAVAPLAESPRVSPGFFIRATLFDLNRLAELIAVPAIAVANTTFKDALGRFNTRGSPMRGHWAHPPGYASARLASPRITFCSSRPYLPVCRPAPFTNWCCSHAARALAPSTRGANGLNPSHVARVAGRGPIFPVNWIARHTRTSRSCTAFTLLCCRRHAIITPYLAGVAAPSSAASARTIRRWLAQWRLAEQGHGCGYLGLLPTWRQRGNRKRRLPEATLVLLEEFLTSEYETLKQKREFVVYAALQRACERSFANARGASPWPPCWPREGDAA